ncbi:zinc_ribbon_2 domain-containing protein, partial [Durusdinium trenchii]
MRSLVFASVWATSHAAGVSAPWASASCQAAPGCAALELQGECCPNPEGVTLDCCQLARCSSHPQCASLGLGGDCCPNTDGISLDCCSSSLEVTARGTQPPSTTLARGGSDLTSAISGSDVQGAQHGVQEAAQEEQEEVQRPQGRIGPLSMIGFLLLLICVPGLCCWFCWIKVLNKGDRSKARSLPEIVDMESVSGVSTRTEPTVSQAESSACQ